MKIKDISLAHVERLNTIAKLRGEGFQGPDKSLKISLVEYNLIWYEVPEENEILFVYQIPNRNKICFDHCSFKKDLNVLEEFNWVSWTRFNNNYLGIPLIEWINFPLERKIYDLFLCYGAENIFGSSYWEGFEITFD